MDSFIDAWRRGVYPLRQKFGFTFVGAWRVDGADEFVWIPTLLGISKRR